MIPQRKERFVIALTRNALLAGIWLKVSSLEKRFEWQGLTSERDRKCHSCQKVSQMPGIARIVGWALATLGLVYKRFVIISFNPKEYNENLRILFGGKLVPGINMLVLHMFCRPLPVQAWSSPHKPRTTKRKNIKHSETQLNKAAKEQSEFRSA